MLNETSIHHLVGSVLFAVALLHTFSCAFIHRLGHRFPRHAGAWHLLGEVEVVFGFWAFILFAYLLFAVGQSETLTYIKGRNFTEPMFVFVIMVVAASRAILEGTAVLVDFLARLLPLKGLVGLYFLTLSILPLLGSLITEPAAMTLAALFIGRDILSRNASAKLCYITIGVLFVNVSIGGSMTSFAAPPILMVANTWGWDTSMVFQLFGNQVWVAVLINSALATIISWRELKTHQLQRDKSAGIPFPVFTVHVIFLALIIWFAHYPPVFIGVFLLFMACAVAYPQFQNRLLLREGLMVATFLAGLVVLGGLQSWWLQPLIETLSAEAVFFSAIALTAITDNAALTYLGSLVPNLSDSFKYMLVAGAVTGGGLTVIANAPNPAGATLLKRYFPDGTINPLYLFGAASIPTAIVATIFYWFR